MILLVVAILLVTIFYWKCIKPMSYWKKKGVPQGNPVWFAGDNWKTITKKESFPEMVTRLYNLFPKDRYFGVYQFNTPTLMIRDPELIRKIAVKDFDNFIDRRAIIPREIDPLWSSNLADLTGQKWRDMRATLSPAFTSSKLKSMFGLITECGERFANYFVEKTANGKEITVEMKDAYTRYANDVIATTAFGITCDSLKDQNNEFYLMGKDATDFKSFSKSMTFLVYLMSPSFAKIVKLKIFSEKVRTFFTRIVKETITARETNGIVRPDMIHLLLEAKKGRLECEENHKNSSDDFFLHEQESDVANSVIKSNDGRANFNHKKEITDLDITAQAMVFFMAGFDTVSTAMCFLTYELAVNPDIQEKLYQEIKKYNNETLTYEVLLKMKYLDMVISETLRKWPPGIAADRVCVKPYTIPAQLPNENPIHLDTNDAIWLPFYALHHDQKYYPNPEKFDPERFSDENKQNIAPYTYLPFGVGPRNCIGSRFALLEIKAAICALLSKFEITVIDKTPIPMKICRKQFKLASETGYWVGLKPRK